jgi:hypothetical protein|eukprot:COSAG01_NODE_2868_length_6946_cov_9.537024_4_plen_34_part_00
MRRAVAKRARGLRKLEAAARAVFEADGAAIWKH